MELILKRVAEIQKQYPDAVIMFEVGDQYEIFGEDAVRVSRELGTILTSRVIGDTTYKMTGFPRSSGEENLTKIVRAFGRTAVVNPEYNFGNEKPVKNSVKRNWNKHLLN